MARKGTKTKSRKSKVEQDSSGHDTFLRKKNQRLRYLREKAELSPEEQQEMLEVKLILSGYKKALT